MHIDVKFEDYISGNAIKELADAEFLDSGAVRLQKFHQNKTPVFYCHTHRFQAALPRIADFNSKIVLLTHNGDAKITTSPNAEDADVRLMPENVVKWFGCNILDHNDRTVSIPTGLENTHHFPELNKARKIFDINSQVKQHRNLCYMNFNPNTNPSERGWLYHNLVFHDWVTTRYGRNGNDFESYLNDIYNHTFVLCPEGNSNGHPRAGGGVGSHRVWECLYANTIPILTKGIQSEPFYDLPILFINDWNEISEDFLRCKYDEFKSKTFNIDQLKLSYWKDQISK